MKKYVIAGGSGFIGQKLTTLLVEAGHTVTILSRSLKKDARPQVSYSTYDSDLTSLMHATDVVINLAGENLFGSIWTDSVKKRIVTSRLETTKRLSDAIEKATRKPEVFISASAVGIYGDRGEEELTENSTVSSGFLADLCIAWEKEALRVTGFGVRVVLPRIGIVLEPGGGALDKMILPFKLFVGGPLGGGKQYFPWIHMDDLCSILLFLINNDNLSGVFNATAPNPVDMKSFTQTLGQVLNRPSWIPVPAFGLKLILGEAANPILASHRVIPQKLIHSGYRFSFPHLKPALADLLV